MKSLSKTLRLTLASAMILSTAVAPAIARDTRSGTAIPKAGYTSSKGSDDRGRGHGHGHGRDHDRGPRNGFPDNHGQEEACEHANSHAPNHCHNDSLG